MNTDRRVCYGDRLQFTAGDWWITVSYPIVRPDLTIYSITVDNTATAFHWEGQVTAQGQVSE